MMGNLQSEGRALDAAAPASFTFGAQSYSPVVHDPPVGENDAAMARLGTLPQRITPVVKP